MFHFCLKKYQKEDEIPPDFQIQFRINGKDYLVLPSKAITPETSLNTFIRLHAKLPGTKFMCLEGGCGTCVVSLRGINPVTKEHTTWAVNSCLWPVFSCHGLEVITIEGIGNRKDGYHHLQKRLAHFNGTQCGFCSPGMVMNMYSLEEKNMGNVTMKEVENSFNGNICRCTGYRPILDAFKSAATDAPDHLLQLCDDIEDLGKVRNRCTKPCETRKIPVNLADPFGKKWFKVHALHEILDIFHGMDVHSKYILIHGNTAHGVYRRDHDLDVFIDVTAVDELHAVNVGEHLALGPNVSLTDTMNTLLWAADQSSNFEYCREVRKHIDLVANVPVRNVASLAGNLMIKHQHNEFPSDIFLLLETVGATLDIFGNGEQVTVRPSEFLTMDMNRKIITKIVLPPLSSGVFIFRSYKILPRAQNVHAYVNAGFLIKLNSKNIVEHATIVYGGISPRFIHASTTEAYLVGKDIIDNETFTAAIASLHTELIPDWQLPDASPVYRKDLAIGLFYKFVLSITPKWKLNPVIASGGTLLDRPLSSGVQDFESKQEEWPLTKYISKVEALIQCSGEAQYVNDIPRQPFELWAAFVVASDVGATIAGFDTNAAMALPGVKHFFTANDIPGVNSFVTPGLDEISEDEELFCSNTVKFNGQPVGIILAEDFEIAYRAAALVKVVYRTVRMPEKTYFNMRHVLMDPEAAHRIRVQSKKEHEPVTESGIKIKGYFEASGQFHFSMETHTCLVVPSDIGLNVYSSTQWMDLVHTSVARSLKIPKNSINMSVKRVGGAYGSKVSRCSQIACAAALGAHLTNRPVRLLLKIERNMESIGKRLPFISDYELEVEGNGKILRLMNTFTEDFGCSINELREVDIAGNSFRNCYNPAVIGHEGKAVLTDAPKNTWCRAPGTMEGIAMIETIMEHIAYDLKRDPVEVRLTNMPSDSPMRGIMNEFLIDTEYRKRQANIHSFNLANRWRKRGIACVPMKYPLEYFGHYHAHVTVYQGDGTVAISHGGIEMGQGINTKAVQVAAYILKIPIESIAVKPSDVFTAPNNTVSAVSITSDSVCYAVMQACKIILSRLDPYLKKHPSWQDAVYAAFKDDIDLVAIYMYKRGDAIAYDIWGIAAAEVEVDILTGNYIFHRVDVWEDVGESISPGVDVGQLEGAFVMGMGYWLTEELVYDSQDGRILTNRTWNYWPPMSKDIPVDFRVKFLKNRPNPFGVLRSKSIGEPPLTMAIVCLFALRNALNSARKDAKLPEEYFTMLLPASPEHVFLSSGNTLEQFVLN